MSAMGPAGKRIALGCSGVLGFAVFAVVTLGVMIPALMFVWDDSAWITWGVIIASVLLGWQAAIRTDRMLRRRINGHDHRDE